ncbi:MAG: hypothetical protein ACLRP8_03375 [Roseburia intestinalis]
MGEIISCDLCFDGRYYAVSGKCLVDGKSFICYDVVTRTSLSLGDRVTMKEGSCLFLGKNRTGGRGEVIFTYALRETVIAWVPWEDSRTMQECHLSDPLSEPMGSRVEVAFDIDKTAAGGNRYGFAPATGNLMYCMPQKGTKTALYMEMEMEARE